MILKILGDWTYTPSFGGNKNMTITFSRLSGAEEMAILQQYPESSEQHVQLFLAALKGIFEPIKLEEPDGKLRDMVADDLVKVGELKGLFYELLGEYADKTRVDPASLKKP